jgi:hypothetical protein
MLNPSSSIPQNTSTGSRQDDASSGFDGKSGVVFIDGGRPVIPSTMLIAGTSLYGSVVFVLRALNVVRPPCRSARLPRQAKG